MKKAIAFLFLLLLIVLFIGVVLFFRGAPQLVPESLKPALSWVDEKQEAATDQLVQWQRQLAGEQAPIVGSDSASSSEPLAQVTLGRNEVSTVTVDDDGKVAVKPQAGLTQSSTPDASTAQANNDKLLSPAADTEGSSSAELDAIARADAAIAAADAALARAQGRSVAEGVTQPQIAEPAALASAEPSAESGTSPATSPTVTARTPAASTPAASTPAASTPASAGGSALGGASIALSQAARPLEPTEPTVLAAIPAPTIIPPDAPSPIPAASEAGRTQQAIIENFLAGEVVEFETGRDVLTTKGRRALQALLGIIEQNNQSVITIQGHTDSIGDERSNLELSTARAIAARNYLIRRGVKADRLLVQGFGERQPISSNKTSAGRERNRRIDFAISDR